VDGAYANNVFQASAAIMAPYDASRLTTVVSSVVIDNNGKATVAWSLAKNAAAHAKGSSFPLASGLKVPNSSLIVSEVSYDYKPVVGYVFGELQLTDTSSVPPRVTGQGNGIACTAPGC
jgi:Flp pilus assembly protein TadG